MTASVRRARIFLLLGAAIACGLILFTLDPIPQDPKDHDFADGRTMLGIPNFLNVVSNLPFLVVGVLALRFLLSAESIRPDGPFRERGERRPFLLLFAGEICTAAGSAYYHGNPTTSTLFWDRLPLTILFASFFGITVIERIGARTGVRLFPLFVAAGAASVVHWHLGEQRGAGDLRFYALVQFYPLVAIPLMVLLFPPRYTRSGDLFLVLGCYGVAKLFEVFDGPILRLGGIVSGHTLKHLTAAAATYLILRMIRLRKPMEEVSR